MSDNEKKQATCWLTGKFEVGDIVTRGGDDRQKILILDTNGYDMTEVECIREPLGWSRGPHEDVADRRSRYRCCLRGG